MLVHGEIPCYFSVSLVTSGTRWSLLFTHLIPLLTLLSTGGVRWTTWLPYLLTLPGMWSVTHPILPLPQLSSFFFFFFCHLQVWTFLGQLPPSWKPSLMREVCGGFLIWTDCICFLSLFVRCSSLRKMIWDKNITWNWELAWQIGNFDCSFQT